MFNNPAPVSWIRLQGKHWAVCVGGVGGVGRSRVKWRYINGYCRYTLKLTSHLRPHTNTNIKYTALPASCKYQEKQTTRLNLVVNFNWYFLLDLLPINLKEKSENLNIIPPFSIPRQTRNCFSTFIVNWKLSHERAWVWSQNII